MLHTKFRENWPTGSGEEDFRRVFTIYGRGGHLGHVTSIMSSVLFFFCFLLWFNVPVNNFSVMLRRSHLFLGITSTYGE